VLGYSNSRPKYFLQSVTVFSATKKREPCIAVLARQCWIWIDPSTDWIGLDWIGLDWIGWNGMDWIGLGWIGLDWIGLGGMDWIGLGGMTVFFSNYDL